MGVRTRSANNSPVKAGVTVVQQKSAIIEPQIPAPKVLVVPRNLTPEARLIHLKHPRDGSMTRFLFCPSNGLFEFTKVAAAAGDLRSILFSASDMEMYDGTSADPLNNTISHGFISQSADILITTPFDVAFILLATLAPESASKKSMFQPLDDLLDIPESEDRHLKYILSHGATMVEQAMSRMCDTVDAGDEKMYRYSEEKVLKFWLDRANQVVDKGLPASLEERFVTRALEAPVLSIKREETIVETPLNEEVAQSPALGHADSQSTTASTTASVVFSEVSEISSVATVLEATPESDIRRLLRLRVALDFISATCLPPKLGPRLQERLTDKNSPISFKSLDEELQRISTLRAEALASRSLTDFSRKRTSADDDEAAEMRAEKKRKLEEDEKRRKANESRGVRDLKKVNVSGMKKMSDFFTKKPATAKVKT